MTKPMTGQDRAILVVDDDEGIRHQLRWALDELQVLEAGNRDEALKLVRDKHPPVALLDLGLPPDPDGPSEGLMTLRDILSIAPTTKVIMISGQTEREYAVEAIGLGAYDFYEKPIELDVLGHIVQRAFRVHELEADNHRLATAASGFALPDFLTTNSEMLQICDTVRKLAQTDVSLLILGESGTGKEVIARAIHKLGPRRVQPFVAINCASIPAQLIESELFGHEKGAFTGAVKTTPGKIELADQGVLLLDEVGDLPLGLQANLLRFLQERVIERVGGRTQIPVNTRVISATNRDLRQLIADGQFREDLYYRLSEVDVHIPPLRDRADDVLMLAHHLLDLYRAEHGSSIRGFNTAALTAIAGHAWPGNVRELQNRVKRAVITCTGSRITVSDLDLQGADFRSAHRTLKDVRQDADIAAIRDAMRRCKGNISKAARLLDTSRPTLYQLLEQYNLKDEFEPGS